MGRGVQERQKPRRAAVKSDSEEGDVCGRSKVGASRLHLAGVGIMEAR